MATRTSGNWIAGLGILLPTLLGAAVGSFVGLIIGFFLGLWLVSKIQSSPKAMRTDKFKDTERYILQSGDADAILTWQRLKRHPESLERSLRDASRHNRVLQDGLNILLGLVALDLLTEHTDVNAGQAETDFEASSFDSDDELIDITALDSLDEQDDDWL
jgi:hypothetical protein